jgi:hypothetical protein
MVAIVRMGLLLRTRRMVGSFRLGWEAFQGRERRSVAALLGCAPLAQALVPHDVLVGFDVSGFGTGVAHDADMVARFGDTRELLAAYVHDENDVLVPVARLLADLQALSAP